MKENLDSELIISLIKDDLINSKLVNGLIDAGLDASNYQLHLADTVFQLMGFKDDHYSDEVFKMYLTHARKARIIDIRRSGDALNELAGEIYERLVTKVP
jgi:hypothetical protein